MKILRFFRLYFSHFSLFLRLAPVQLFCRYHRCQQRNVIHRAYLWAWLNRTRATWATHRQEGYKPTVFPCFWNAFILQNQEKLGKNRVKLCNKSENWVKSIKKAGKTSENRNEGEILHSFGYCELNEWDIWWKMCECRWWWYITHMSHRHTTRWCIAHEATVRMTTHDSANPW